MTSFLRNILLAILWVALTGHLSAANLALGFGLGALVELFLHHERGSPGYLIKLTRVLRLALYFLWELLLSNLRVALDVATPRYAMRPGIVAVPLDARTDAEITLLSNLISLTPGTLSLHVSESRTTLYVHSMYIRDAETTRRQIKRGLERRVLEVFR
jgi:multicomponent Na+:H+ antiporter subunit E